jgi:ABC-type transport system involved in multi-copper enzyme maturation permease subunit
MSWATFVIALAFIYATVNTRLIERFGIPTHIIPILNARFFMVYLISQLPFVFFFTLAVGPPLIANDIHHKALPMILSKPISRWEYLLGKFLVLFLLLSCITWFPGTILFITGTLIVPGSSNWIMYFWSESIYILPVLIIFSFVVIITMNLLVLLFSSIAENYRLAGGELVMFTFGASVVARIAGVVFHSRRWNVLSPINNIISIAESLFKVANTTSIPPALAWVYLLLLWGGCILVLSTRVKAFHVYKE